MHVQQQHTDEIKGRFQKLESGQDLVDLLNYSKRLLYPDVKDSKPIQLKSVTYYANPKLCGKRYYQFHIGKKSGGKRTITAPFSGLKLIQRCLNLILTVVFTPHPAAMGFANNKSVADNAGLHTKKNYVYNTDLKDFFPSIAFRRVKTVLELPPFKLKDELAFLIANLCCYKGFLPQGAPASPVLTNMICQRLDRKLYKLSKESGCTYSRYADDITFSSCRHIYKPGGKFLKALKRIIKEENFSVNESKIRLQRREYRQVVTGIIVNEKVNLDRRYIQKVRAMLHNWEKHGYEKAKAKFLVHYKSDKGHVKTGSPEFMNVLAGKLEYMKMIRGNNDLLYKKYADQFLSLMNEKITGIPAGLNLNNLLDIWENQGVEKAMELMNHTKHEN